MCLRVSSLGSLSGTLFSLLSPSHIDAFDLIDNPIVGAARCHRRSHVAGTHVNSADITCTYSMWGASGAPFDAGNRSNASSSKELSISDVQYYR